MPTTTIRVMTDANGALSRTETFNPPGPFPLTVRIRARLLSPADTTVTGTLDIDAVDGSPQNPAQSFTLPPGQQVSVGEWRLDGGDNRVMVSGQTSPPRPNTEVEIELDATLGF